MKEGISAQGLYFLASGLIQVHRFHFLLQREILLFEFCVNIKDGGNRPSETLLMQLDQVKALIYWLILLSFSITHTKSII